MVMVTRLRYPSAGTDVYGDEVPATTADELAIEAIGLAPGTAGPGASAEDNDGGRQGVPVRWDLYLPYGADVAPTDRVRLADGTEYRVDGEPAHWLNPHTGRKAGTVVSLARWEG